MVTSAMRTFAIRGSLGLAALVLAACTGMPARVEPPSVTVSDLRMGTAGVFEQQFFVKLRVQNPNDSDLQIKGSSFELELNDQPFAKGVSAQSVTVPRFGSEFVEIEAVSSLGNILRQAGAMTSDAGLEKFRYRIKGKLATRNAGSLPFDERGDLSLGGAPAPSK
jgi:LEA14-like dessication related protein